VYCWALVGAAAGYGIQVYNNYQNGVTGSAAWTQNISAEPIVGGALIGAGAVIFAPAAVAAVGDVLVGAGVTTGSTALFGAGMSAYGASTALGNAITGAPAVATIPGLAPPKPPSGVPDFIGTENGDLIPVPSGATGPIPADNGAGFQYTGGSGGNGLDPRVTNVRVMDPTLPKPPSPGYPNGYVSYSNAVGQTVNPYTGQTVSRSDPWWHIELK
jgi:hypothetical protein